MYSQQQKIKEKRSIARIGKKAQSSSQNNKMLYKKEKTENKTKNYASSSTNFLAS